MATVLFTTMRITKTIYVDTQLVFVTHLCNNDHLSEKSGFIKLLFMHFCKPTKEIATETLRGYSLFPSQTGSAIRIIRMDFVKTPFLFFSIEQSIFSQFF